jgi:hypothetical protein
MLQVFNGSNYFFLVARLMFAKEARCCCQLIVKQSNFKVACFVLLGGQQQQEYINSLFKYLRT